MPLSKTDTFWGLEWGWKFVSAFWQKEKYSDLTLTSLMFFIPLYVPNSQHAIGCLLDRSTCRFWGTAGDGQGSLASCCPWGCKESETTEWLNWTDRLRADGPSNTLALLASSSVSLALLQFTEYIGIPPFWFFLWQNFRFTLQYESENIFAEYFIS